MTSISERIREVLDLMKQDNDISSSVNNNIYNDGVLEDFIVPAIYVSYRESNRHITFPGVTIGRRCIDDSIYVVKIYTKTSSEAIALAEKVKNLFLQNGFKYVNATRMKDENYFVFIMEFRKINFGGG